MRKRRETNLERALAYFDTLDFKDGCWLWPYGQQGNGYGKAFESGGKGETAHRIFYKRFVGPIPDGLVIDHRCRNRSCVNPRHLELVTHQTNILRGRSAVAGYAKQTHCHRGHPFADSNLHVDKRNCRHCNTCQRARNRASKARRLAREANGLS